MFQSNLSGKVDAAEGPYRGHLPSAIYSTKAKTLEVSMTEKFHRQKISFMDRNFIQSPYKAKKEVKNRWKK
jgi:hypothetical protein